MKAGRLWILSGDIGTGKTSLCRNAADMARAKGIDTAGVISPAAFEAGVKTGISALDLRTRRSRCLAVLRENAETDLATGRWSFFKETFDWGNRVLKAATPCSLLTVDELGPLEFERGEGWKEGLHALDSGDFQAALTVVRPALLTAARIRWPQARIWQLEAQQDIEKSAEKLLHEMGLPH